MKFNLSKVNSLAWKIRKTGKSWSEAMQNAYAGLRAKAQLQSNVCRIIFIKSDGTRAERVGTLDPSFFPAFNGTKSNRTRTSEKISFYSLTDGGWRSFLPQNLLSIQVESATMAAAA
ncbi:MAG: SH3 beta-barrel fold-containing protein [Saprospiraceae bacterium]|nr:DUF2693 domain-containing protein [Lewinella sp.]